MNNLDFNFFCRQCKKSREYREANCFTKYRIKRFRQGEYLAIKGDKVLKLSLLVSGSITVSFVLPTGTEIRKVKHSAPYPMGALALLGKENRYRVYILANEECEVISVKREEVERQIMSCREFMLSFFDYSTSKLDIFAEHLAILTQRSIAAKLAYYIFSCSKDGKSYKFTKSIKELAEYIAVERPSLSRVIANFVDEGYITYYRGTGEILKVRELEGIIDL